MQYEPRPTIHIENQLGWAHKLRGAESLGISKVGQTVLPRLMEFQIWYQLAGSMTLLEGGLRKETVASAGLDVRNFSFSLYPTGALQAATPVLELRGSESG